MTYNPPHDQSSFLRRDDGGAGGATFALCCAVAFLDGADSQAMAIAAPAFARTLAIAPGALGLLFSISLAGAVSGALACLTLVKHWGSRWTLVACTIAFGVFQLASAFAIDYWQLVFARLGAGVGLGGANASFLALAAVTLPPARRSTLLSLLWAFFPLGGLIGGIVNGWLVHTQGWSAMFIVGGLLPLPVAVLLSWSKPAEQAILPATKTTDGQFVRALGHNQLLRSQTLLLCIVFLAAFGTLAGIGMWVPSLIAARGLSVIQGGQILSWHALGALISMATAGKLIRHWGSRTLTVGLTAGAVALVLLGASLESYREVAFLMVSLGIFLGVVASGGIALAGLIFPEALRPSGMAISMAARSVGQLLLPSMMGVLLGAGTSPGTTMVLLALIVLLAAFAAAMLKWRPASAT